MTFPASVTPAPDLVDLFAQFSPADDLPTITAVSPEAVPPPFQHLLVHDQHMTVTVEAYHGDLVDVRVLKRHIAASHYSRKIVLELQQSRQRVLFGIVRVNLDYCSVPVCAEILGEKTPFGRVLIKHNVMRRIEPIQFVRVEPGPRQLAWFGLKERQELYGRLAYIHCDEQPAVELFEVVTA
jgi:hypothetical protein